MGVAVATGVAGPHHSATSRPPSASSSRAGASPGHAKRSKDVSGAHVNEGSAEGLFRGLDRGGGKATASTRAVLTTRGAGSGVFRRGAVAAAL